MSLLIVSTKVASSSYQEYKYRQPSVLDLNQATNLKNIGLTHLLPNQINAALIHAVFQISVALVASILVVLVLVISILRLSFYYFLILSSNRNSVQINHFPIWIRFYIRRHFTLLHQKGFYFHIDIINLVLKLFRVPIRPGCPQACVHLIDLHLVLSTFFS